VKLRLCRLEELLDGDARGFDLGPGAEPREIFLYRDGGRVLAYENLCPHMAAPLDMSARELMAPDGAHFLCSTHGALFRVEDGLCVAGPCHGQALAQLAVEVDPAGDVHLVGED
jgi:nitrite reductase/ring-hydroxylating ferredoxin subunit